MTNRSRAISVAVTGSVLPMPPTIISSKASNWVDRGADATEIHIAGFLRTLLPEDEAPARDSSQVRLTAIALWHIAKAALVRDFAEARP